MIELPYEINVNTLKYNLCADTQGLVSQKDLA